MRIGDSTVRTAITSYFSVAITSTSATPPGTRLAGRLEIKEDGEEVMVGEFGDGNKCLFQTCEQGKWRFTSKQKATYFDHNLIWSPASGFYTVGPARQLTLVASLTLPGKLATTSGLNVGVDKTDKLFDFRPLLREPMDSDIVLKCKDRAFPCHKVILRAR